MKRILTTLKEKWPEYLLEIFVLIIGIYGAFAVDNWNENRKQAENLKIIYQIVKDDLKKNNATMNRFIERYEQVRKPAFDSILFSSLTKEDYQQDVELNKRKSKFYWVFGGYEDIAINTRGYDLLKNQANNVLLENNLPYKIAEFYDNHLVEIEVAAHELSVEFKDNFMAFKQKNLITNHLAYGKSDEYYEYIANSQDAKNRINTYFVFYSIYVHELKSFREEATLIINEIDNFLATK